MLFVCTLASKRQLGAHFVNFENIKLQPNERPEDLFQRFMAFVENSAI